jgi:hypothetical protein
MKYDIIYEPAQNPTWTSEKIFEVYDLILGFCEEFAIEENRKPVVENISLGLCVWEYITMHPSYNHFNKRIMFYDLEIIIPRPDWSLNFNYIELNLV